MTITRDQLDRALAELDDAIGAAENELRPLGEELESLAEPLEKAAEQLATTWSQSNAGRHAFLYFGNFEIPPAHMAWDTEWGFVHRQPGWETKAEDEVVATIESIAGTSIDALVEKAISFKKTAEERHHQISLLLERLPDEFSEANREFGNRRKEFLDLDPPLTAQQFLRHVLPNQMVSRDSTSVHQGVWAAPHQGVWAKAIAAATHAKWALSMLRLARRVHASAHAIPVSSPGVTSPGAVGDQRSQTSGGQPVRGPAAAVALVMFGAVMGTLWLTSAVADRREAAAGAGEILWRLAAALVGGAGMFLLVFGCLVLFYGVGTAEPTYLTRAARTALLWGGAAAALAALAFLFNIA